MTTSRASIQSTSPLMRRALAQERREQPRRPDFAVPGDHVAHRVRRGADEAHGLQHAGDVAAIALQLRDVRGARRRGHQGSREFQVACACSASMAGMKSPSGFSARLTSASNASVTPRQADSTTASRGLGDASTISATRRKQPASATLEPPNLCTIHLSMLHTRPCPKGRSCRSQIHIS